MLAQHDRSLDGPLKVQVCRTSAPYKPLGFLRGIAEHVFRFGRRSSQGAGTTPSAVSRASGRRSRRGCGSAASSSARRTTAAPSSSTSRLGAASETDGQWLKYRGTQGKGPPRWRGLRLGGPVTRSAA